MKCQQRNEEEVELRCGERRKAKGEKRKAKGEFENKNQIPTILLLANQLP
jgi:hypothetical protein